MVLDQYDPNEPSMLGAAWRYRWMVLAFGLGFAAIAFLAALLVPQGFLASSILVVEDPKASQIFNTTGVQAPDRYVQDQVSILESTAVAKRATELAAETDPDVQVDTKEATKRAQIASNRSSNVIEVNYTDPDANQAIVMANAIAEAYQEVRRTEALASFDRALTELDTSIASLDQELADLQQQIEDLTVGDPARAALISDYEDALVRLDDLQARAEETTGEAQTQIRDELDDVYQQLQALQLVFSLDAQRPDLVVLLNHQNDATNRRSTLTARRDQLGVDAELSSGIALYFPSTASEEAGLSAALALIAGFLAGLMVGFGLAYLLARRRHTIATRSAAQVVLAAPLLAEIPDFDDEGLASPLPVYASPRSVAAEAFRFAAAAIELKLDEDQPLGPTSTAAPSAEVRSGPTTVAFVSAHEGDGKSVVVANTALASCWAGNRVLVIDADFGAQAQAELLLSGDSRLSGLGDVIIGEISLRGAVQHVDFGVDLRFDLLTKGQVPVSATDLLRSDEATGFFDSIAGQYDLVLIDTPPLLRVAYSSILARQADRVVVVVPHMSPASAVEGVRERLDLVGTPVAGYIYNRSPLDSEMISYGGSRDDFHATDGSTEPPTSDHRRRH